MCVCVCVCVCARTRARRQRECHQNCILKNSNGIESIAEFCLAILIAFTILINAVSAQLSMKECITDPLRAVSDVYCSELMYKEDLIRLKQLSLKVTRRKLLVVVVVLKGMGENPPSPPPP